ncbi:13208_t:CDS:2 [Ambispora leptoticha]|uniref:13208_t:CDS:1 n=1 Tax=Ambispora leptoticha TaxID=144679 RepID=A0A9N9FGK2_9GLOM|nr:13208_t:CDS:2 [Ambispora leptoticha]
MGNSSPLHAAVEDSVEGKYIFGKFVFVRSRLVEDNHVSKTAIAANGTHRSEEAKTKRKTVTVKIIKRERRDQETRKKSSMAKEERGEHKHNETNKK